MNQHTDSCCLSLCPGGAFFEVCSAHPVLKVFRWILGAVLRRLFSGKCNYFVCELRSAGFKWERASLGKGVPNLATAFLH